MTGAIHTHELASGLLLTDLYQLNMAQAYLDAGLTDTAVFDFYVRDLPNLRNFVLTAGQEQVLDLLENARFTDAELSWLRDSGRFTSTFLDYMAELRFTGDVHALPEGTVVFAGEPILRVEAPLPVAQLLETRLINLMHTSMVVASKAARMKLAAPSHKLVDFGLRRAHGAEAGLLAARAAHIPGFDGTATVPAEPLWGIPITGTMAHAFVEAHPEEEQAFLDFARSRPNDTVFLLDTYDTEAAAHKVVRVARTLADEGIKVHGVRIDSGDLAEQAARVRAILDDGGLDGVPILASGGLDEWTLRELADDEAAIDGFGLGTALTTASDAPAFNCAYKLQMYGERHTRKVSEGKATLPGRKQIWRAYDGGGHMQADVLGLADEPAPGGSPLMTRVMANGERVAPAESLTTVRERAARDDDTVRGWRGRGLNRSHPDEHLLLPVVVRYGVFGSPVEVVSIHHGVRPFYVLHDHLPCGLLGGRRRRLRDRDFVQPTVHVVFKLLPRQLRDEVKLGAILLLEVVERLAATQVFDLYLGPVLIDEYVGYVSLAVLVYLLGFLPPGRVFFTHLPSVHAAECAHPNVGHVSQLCDDTIRANRVG